MSKYESGYSWSFGGPNERVTVRTGKIENGEIHSLMVSWNNGPWLPLTGVLQEYFVRAEDGQMTLKDGEF